VKNTRERQAGGIKEQQDPHCFLLRRHYTTHLPGYWKAFSFAFAPSCRTKEMIPVTA
jgi:hypothetical protein